LLIAAHRRDESIGHLDGQVEHGASLNSAARQEPEIPQDAKGALFPSYPVFGLDGRECACNPMPAVLDRALALRP
jgi:hypothetical protein